MISRSLFCAAFIGTLLLIPAICSAEDYYVEHPAAPFHSTTLQEYAPVQKTAANFPNNLQWRMNEIPTIDTYRVNFSGKPGHPASHEGMDFVHNKATVPHVPVIAVAKGTVAYVRTGCPQSGMLPKTRVCVKPVPDGAIIWFSITGMVFIPVMLTWRRVQSKPGSVIR